VLLGVASSATARPVRNWTQQQLFDEADIVVVATASERKKTENSDDFLTDHLQQYETELDVKSVLKGKGVEPAITDKVDKENPNPKVIKFVHFRYRADAKSTLGNGPSFAVLKPITETKGGSANVPQYLLYLRKRKDGRYEPVTGNMDPKESIFRLVPHPHQDAGFDEGANSAQLHDEHREIKEIAKKEVTRREGWSGELAVDVVETKNGWDARVWRIPAAPAGFVTVEIQVEKRVTGYRKGK